MLVRYPPSEIQAELLSNTSMQLFRIYGLLAFNCVYFFRRDAPLNAAQNVPLNAAQGVGKNNAQDGGQNDVQVDGQNALQTVSQAPFFQQVGPRVLQTAPWNADALDREFEVNILV